MRKLLFIFLLLISLKLSAQTITQSQSQDIGSMSISVTNPTMKFLRFFKMEDYGINSDYSISNIQFGISFFDDQGSNNGFINTSVKLYSTTKNFPSGYPNNGYTVIGNQTSLVPNQDETVFTFPINAVVPQGTNLVVEINFEQATEGSQINLGFNSLGETSPTYLSDDGGIGTLEQRISEGYHLVMNVNGNSDTANITDNLVGNSLTVYPNPAKEFINIKSVDIYNVNSVVVTDITGKNINAQTDGKTINVAMLTPGIYFLKISTNNGFVIKKFIKQ